MDQIRIGAFLKALRKEKELTQEQLAEQLKVSGRTVSRWETGSNMPDIGMLIDIADFYDVSIPELINGERKSENMEPKTKETAIAMAEYSRMEGKTGKQKTVGFLLLAFGRVSTVHFSQRKQLGLHLFGFRQRSFSGGRQPYHSPSGGSPRMARFGGSWQCSTAVRHLYVVRLYRCYPVPSGAALPVRNRLRFPAPGSAGVQNAVLYGHPAEPRHPGRAGLYSKVKFIG